MKTMLIAKLKDNVSTATATYDHETELTTIEHCNSKSLTTDKREGLKHTAEEFEKVLLNTITNIINKGGTCELYKTNKTGNYYRVDLPKIDKEVEHGI